MKKSYLIWLLILLVCLPMASTDIFIPVLPILASYYNSNIETISFCLSSYLTGFAISVLLSGVLSDSLGRKVVMQYSIALYIIASILIALNHNLWLFIGFRFLQGLGGGTGTVVARLIIKDIFDKKQQVKVMTILATGMALSPALAPLVGQYLSIYFSWKICFWISGFIGCYMLYLIKFHYIETMPKSARKEIEILRLLPQFISALKHKQFLGYLLLICFSWTAYFTFIGLSSFLLQNKYHVSQASYSYMMIALSIGYFLGSKCTSILSVKHNTEKIAKLGVIVCSISIIIYCCGDLTNHLGIFLVSIIIVRAGIGLIMPSSQVGALNTHSENIGWYMGCLYFIEFIISGILLNVASIFEARLFLGSGIIIIMLLSAIFMWLGIYLISNRNSH